MRAAIRVWVVVAALAAAGFWVNGPYASEPRGILIPFAIATLAAAGLSPAGRRLPEPLDGLRVATSALALTVLVLVLRSA